MNRKNNLSKFAENKLLGKYPYYAEQVTKLMSDAGIIFDEEVNDMQDYIRGCA